MQTIDLATESSILTDLRPVSPLPVGIEPCFNFTSSQQEFHGVDPNIADLVASKTAKKEFFYGIEIMAQNRNKLVCVDFNVFLPLLPSFISIVWSKHFSESVRRTGINQVTSMQLIPHLNTRIHAMPHLSLYKLTQRDLDDFLALNLNNVLVIRGDYVDEAQDYRYAYQVVEYLRQARGNNISIAVGGYPEGYTSLTTEPRDKVQDLKYLKLKIDAGGNFIISQLCYSGDKIVEFIRDARSAGITVPIVVGMVIPDSLRKYQMIERFTRVSLPPPQREELEKLQTDDQVKDYFVQLTVRNIQHVMDADLGVYGIQFFTLNQFESVVDVLRELRAKGILKEPADDDSI